MRMNKGSVSKQILTSAQLKLFPECTKGLAIVGSCRCICSVDSKHTEIWPFNTCTWDDPVDKDKLKE